MKRIILLTALMSLMSGAQAARGQIYVGPFIGSAHTDAKLDLINNTGSIQRHNKVGSTDFLGGLLVGYAYPCNNLLMGFEISGNWNTASKKVMREVGGLNEESFKFEHKASYGFAARLGYRTNSDTTLYVRLGGEWSNYKFSYRGAVSNTGHVFTASKSKTNFTFVPGVGIEMPVAGKWKARLEAKYSLPQNVKLSIGNDPAAILNFENTRNRLRVGHTAVVMGVTYNFG